eukprot:TRINITY_DN20605_c0_g1_i1.p2 TRINITY_DN20605_c0_g1~~TRINITY_DN20605_c0_g1_i1.p2  ORF type:complete len:115 (+),score=2.52 TRINITY_DN20605_c0_g1_i1:141-485(+)
MPRDCESKPAWLTRAGGAGSPAAKGAPPASSPPIPVPGPGRLMPCPSDGSMSSLGGSVTGIGSAVVDPDTDLDGTAQPQSSTFSCLSEPGAADDQPGASTDEVRDDDSLLNRSL